MSYRPPLLALDHFTFAFSPCTIYCLVGPSGSGKTTLLRVLLGLLTPDKGTVAFATNHQGAKLRVGYVPQKITLGRMSLGNQITYPDAKIDATRAYDALKQVGLADFVGALPQKLETIVGDDGRTLSGGQAQRLLLARLFYHRFDLILIDEGTSALDPASERLFYEAIKSLAKSATIIMIAHRPMAAEYADHCIRLKHGRVDVDHES